MKKKQNQQEKNTSYNQQKLHRMYTHNMSM